MTDNKKPPFEPTKCWVEPEQVQFPKSGGAGEFWEEAYHDCGVPDSVPAMLVPLETWEQVAAYQPVCTSLQMDNTELRNRITDLQNEVVRERQRADAYRDDCVYLRTEMGRAIDTEGAE